MLPALLRSEQHRRRYGLMRFFSRLAKFSLRPPAPCFSGRLFRSDPLADGFGVAQGELCDRRSVKDRVEAGISARTPSDFFFFFFFATCLETKQTFSFELKVMAERGARVLLSLLCLTSACSLAPARAQKGKCVRLETFIIIITINLFHSGALRKRERSWDVSSLTNSCKNTAVIFIPAAAKQCFLVALRGGHSASRAVLKLQCAYIFTIFMFLLFCILTKNYD